MPSLGSIFVDLLLDDAKFVEGTKKGSKGVSNFEKDVKKAAQGAAVAIAAVTTAFGALLTRQALIADETNKAARSLGIATENYQALALVADEAGVAQENLANLIGKSQKTIVAAVQGGSAKAFEAIGLSVKDLINLKPDEQFEAIAVALSQIENPTTRNAIAMQIFGKSGRDVVNMLEDFGAKVEEARAFNDRFNISLSDIDGRKIEEANDTFARLEKAMGGFFNTVAIQVAPVITGLSNELLNAGANGQTFTQTVTDGMKGVGFAVDVARVSFLGLEGALKVVQIVITSVGAAALQVLADLARVPLTIASVFSDSAKEAQKALDDAAQFATDTNTVLKGQLAGLNEEFSRFETFGDKITRFQEEAQKRAEAASKLGAPGNISPDLSKDAVEQQKKLLDLYKQNRTYIENIDAKTIKYHDTLKELKQLLDGHIISYEQYNKAIGALDKEFQAAADSAKDNLDDMSVFAERAAENIQDSLAETLFSPFDEGTDDMLEKWKKTLRDMIQEALAADIGEALFGKKGASGRSGGLFGDLLGSFDFSRIFGGSNGQTFNGEAINWNLPGFATGIDRVPMDMPAIIHQDEAVLNKAEADAWRNGRSGGNVYQIDARGADAGAVARIERALLGLAGPGVVEKRVSDAQMRGRLA